MQRPGPHHLLIHRFGVAMAGLVCGMVCAAFLSTLAAPASHAAETAVTTAI